MRPSALFVSFLLACCVLSSPGNSQAQEYPSEIRASCSTYMQFDEENGRIYAQAYLQTSYIFNVYYNISISARLEGSDGSLDFRSDYGVGQSMSNYQDLWVYLSLEAWADTQYTITADYFVEFSFNDEYGYYDFWDFAHYQFAQINAPFFYDFIGYLMNNMYGGGSTSHLGAVHSNKKTGVPHHVKVYSDVNREVPGCGARERVIKYRIVDSDGKPVGTTYSRELFRDQQRGYELPFVNNDCALLLGEEAGLEAYIYPTQCSIDRGGIIADGMFVGCTGGADCGPADFIDSWITCQSGKPEATVTTNTYRARSQEMLINGRFLYNRGEELY